MELSVIVTYQRDPLLKKCLQTLQEALVGIDYEIIVVMSEYKQEVMEKFRADFPDVVFLPFAENLYYVRCANRGLERAKGDFILIMNSDVFVSGEAIQGLIAFLKSNPDVGLVGPRVLYPDSSEQPSAFRFYTPFTVVCRRSFLGKAGFCKGAVDRFLYRDKNFNAGKGFEVEWLSNGAGAITTKESVKKVGLLDERFCHYFSDVDWSRRFWEKGLKVVYSPQVTFYHHHGKRSAGGAISLLFNKIARIHLIDGIKYFWKWGLKATPIHGKHTDDADKNYPGYPSEKSVSSVSH